MASKIKKALKKIGKAALVAGAGYAAMKGLKNRKENKDFLKTEGGDKSDMKNYGPYSNKAAPKTRSNASIAGDFISKINNPKSMESGMQMSNDLVNYKLPARNNKSIADSLAYNSTFAQNQRRNAPVTGTTLPGMKSGGRVKGCGKALRGFGKAMKGKR